MVSKKVLDTDHKAAPGDKLWARNRGKVATYEPGRVCANKECNTVLSIYNEDDYCARHAPFDETVGRVPQRIDKGRKKKGHTYDPTDMP